MNYKMKFGLLLLTVAALVLAPMASALPTYAAQTGASCGTCHVSPGGGGTLTPAGNTFKNTGKLPVATPPKVTPPVVVTPPKVTPPVVTTPTQPTAPTAPTIVDEENDHHDGDHHNGQKEQREQEEEHDED